jgi:hypothetical protein
MLDMYIAYPAPLGKSQLYQQLPMKVTRPSRFVSLPVVINQALIGVSLEAVHRQNSA